MPGVLSGRIAALRKERGLTQEQLGKLVGISSLAVSKWEKGGSPDVELLPVLAEQLGVTIDSLFGLDGGEKIDVNDAVSRWISTVPQGQRLDRLCRLVWAAAGHTVADGSGDLTDLSRYASNCQGKPVEINGKSYLMLDRTRVLLDEGLLLGIRADDMSYAAIFPEPEAGWERFLESNSLYRRFFALLAKPHCLELLEYLHSRPGRFERSFTAGAVAKQTGFDCAEVEGLLDSLAELHLLVETEMETEDGLFRSYCLYECEGLIPFLSFAYWLLAGGGITGGIHERSAPILRGEKWMEKEN